MSENLVPQAKPFRSPSYPQRVHIRERAEWQHVLKDCEDKIARAQASAQGPLTDERRRILGQMLGSRDQVADAAKRLPMEVGALYSEDKERLEEAVKALKRVMEKWEKS